MDILEMSEAWAKNEQAIAEALKAYRRKKQADPNLLIRLFDRYRQSMPKSLHRGIRDILAGKRGAPAKLSPSDRMQRFNMAVFVGGLVADGKLLDEACEEVAGFFGVSDSIVKRAYNKLRLRDISSGPGSILL